jgi:hypothetical protein
MPRGDRTGPQGQGTGTDWGMRHRGGGRGRDGGYIAGPGGDCICPYCRERAPHQLGTPCLEQKCPKCGAAMT